ncbi:TetR family transcriptional regulator [Archangium primigenium]|uniref:TetR family transcriptional regulator n=1 Tax=[Archangium] primigenium TaxID=2792470 RepID=UPI00195C1891|nr:TetR family transcriptional regulator [Archangium primigenium]MBM7118821.1 TetR family transcriptional regulator [Archangium primigenium]
MKRAWLPLLLCLALATPVWAASGLDAPRQEAQRARGRVRELRENQQRLRLELNTLAAHIERLKAEQKGRLVATPELQDALRRSQELSGQLTGLAQSLAGAESEAERGNLALYTVLSQELVRVRAAWEATRERHARAELVARMRELRAERDTLRASLPASQELSPPSLATSDDSEDLLEQVDALRDSEDKVRERLKLLRARLTEVREERELDRRMSDFLGEESMFDEQDRRLSLRLDSTGKMSVNATPRTGGNLLSTGGTADAVQSAPERDPTPATPTPPPTSEPGMDTPPNVGGAPRGGDAAGTSQPPVTATQAADSRPQVGTVRAQTLASDVPDDVRALERETARLEALARELDTRARSLERRARELR